jgi:hypothetical protein
VPDALRWSMAGVLVQQNMLHFTQASAAARQSDTRAPNVQQHCKTFSGRRPLARSGRSPDWHLRCCDTVHSCNCRLCTALAAPWGSPHTRAAQ